MLPCVTMYSVDTYLEKLRGQRRKKTARPFVFTRGEIVCVRVCMRGCVTLSGSNSQLLFTVYDAWASIQKADFPQEGSAVHGTRYKGNSLFRVRHSISRSISPASKRGSNQNVRGKLSCFSIFPLAFERVHRSVESCSMRFLYRWKNFSKRIESFFFLNLFSFLSVRRRFIDRW